MAGKELKGLLFNFAQGKRSAQFPLYYPCARREAMLRVTKLKALLFSFAQGKRSAQYLSTALICRKTSEARSSS